MAIDLLHILKTVLYVCGHELGIDVKVYCTLEKVIQVSIMTICAVWASQRAAPNVMHSLRVFIVMIVVICSSKQAGRIAGTSSAKLSTWIRRRTGFEFKQFPKFFLHIKHGCQRYQTTSTTLRIHTDHVVPQTKRCRATFVSQQWNVSADRPVPDSLDYKRRKATSMEPKSGFALSPHWVTAKTHQGGNVCVYDVYRQPSWTYQNTTEWEWKCVSQSQPRHKLGCVSRMLTTTGSSEAQLVPFDSDEPEMWTDVWEQSRPDRAERVLCLGLRRTSRERLTKMWK